MNPLLSDSRVKSGSLQDQGHGFSFLRVTLINLECRISALFYSLLFVIGQKYFLETLFLSEYHQTDYLCFHVFSQPCLSELFCLDNFYCEPEGFTSRT